MPWSWKPRGVENPTARLFSNPAGDFGSLVNDRVTDANWESGEELAGTWQDRNTFSYGRADKGQARPQVLAALLRSTDRVVQQIDSVEYGLTDIQEYYANTGGLKRAAEVAQRDSNPDGRVAASFVESFSRDTTPRDLEELLRLEYRTKLLNPRWAQSMAAMGSGGAYEISQRMTALIGWGGTSGFRDPWVYDQAADTYALDAAMAQRLREANPEAFRNVVGRMLEASSRGLWNAPAEKLDKLRNLYDLTDAELEGVPVAAGPSGGVPAGWPLFCRFALRRSPSCLSAQCRRGAGLDPHGPAAAGGGSGPGRDRDRRTAGHRQIGAGPRPARPVATDPGDPALLLQCRPVRPRELGRRHHRPPRHDQPHTRERAGSRAICAGAAGRHRRPSAGLRRRERLDPAGTGRIPAGAAGRGASGRALRR